jgi:hypothetical protein
LKSFKIHLIEPGKPEIIKDTIFYCIPDSREWEAIDEKNPNKAGQDINEYLHNLCLQYSLHRKENLTMPAVVLGHGIVKNAKNKNNIIIDKSTVYLDESDLAQIGANIILYGHIHQGYEFETLPGRALSSCNIRDWKDLNYHPAIWEVEMGGELDLKPILFEHRIPFIPRRLKIIQDIDRIVSDDFTRFDNDLIHMEVNKGNPVTKEDLIKAGAHPDSFVTIKPEITHIIRDKEIITAITRRKEYELYWKQQNIIAPEEELIECDKIQNMEAKEGIASIKRTITPLFMHIRGFTPLWVGMQKEEVYIDWTKYKPGILGFMGRGGLSKSNLLGLILPHTENLTNESKTANMFMLPDSFAIRGYKVNDDLIICKIFYKTNKTEYQIWINNELQDAYSGSMSKYENYIDPLFGTPRMCALSMFQSQWPLEKTYGGQLINPNIKVANNSQLKSIFTELLNIDRQFAYNYSKKQFDEFNTIFNTKIQELEGYKKAIDDPAELNTKIIELQNIAENIDSEILTINETIVGLEDAKKVLNNKSQLSQTAEQVVILHKDNIDKNKKEIELQNSYKNYTGESVEDIQKRITILIEQKKDNDIKKKTNEEKQKTYTLELLDYNIQQNNYNEKLKNYEKQKQDIIDSMNERNNTLKNKYIEAQLAYNASIKLYNQNKAKYEQNKNKLEITIQSIISADELFENKANTALEKINLLNKPCFNCGKLDPKNEKEIEKLKQDMIYDRNNRVLNSANIIKLKKELKEFVFTKIEPTAPIEPKYEKQENLIELKTLSFTEIEPTVPTKPIIETVDDTIQDKIDKLINEKENIITMNQKSAATDQVIEKLNKEIKALDSLIVDESKKIIHDIKIQIFINETSINNSSKQLKEKLEQVNKYNADIQSFNDRIKDIVKKQEQLKLYEVEIELLNDKVTLWSHMMTAWGRDGIPAMRLECDTAKIDREVNNLLKKYYPQLMIQTTTLRDKIDGSKMEDFNINLIATQTGISYPLHGLSGEQGNFALTAIREACNKIRERTANIKYNFAVMDEPDNWVSEDLLSAFWEMVNDINKDRDRLIICISHSPAAKDLFEQKINIEDLIPS